MLKEERVINLMKILPNYKEILSKLDEIENKVGIQNIIPFYDELIEIALMGIDIEVKDLENYYKLYSDSYIFNRIKLSQAVRCLTQEMKSTAKELYQYLPWYSKFWIKIKKLLRLGY